MLPFVRKLLATCGPAAALRVPPWKKIPPYFMSLISVGLLFFSLSCENKWKLYCQEWTVLNLLRTTTWIETWLRETWASSGRNSLCAWLNFKRIFSSSQSHARNFAPRPKVLEGRKWNSFRPGVCKSWLCGTLPWKTPMSLVIVCSLGLAYSQPPWREGPQKHSALLKSSTTLSADTWLEWPELTELTRMTCVWCRLPMGALTVFYSLPDGNLALAATKIFASFMCKQVSRQGHPITNVV